MDRINLPSYYTEEDKKIVKLFKEEMDRINLLYLKAVKENDLTKANKLLKQLRTLTKTLIDKYWEWAATKIPKEYLKWVWYVQWIKVSDNLTQSEIDGMLWELWPIHMEAVNALLDNSKNYVRASLDWVERQALSVLIEFHQAQVRAELAKGIISGESWYEMNQRIKDYFLDNEITTFKDKWGKTWTMDRYIDMLVRTETSIANTQWTINRAIQLWITKFRIIERPDCCKECSHLHWTVVDIRDWEVELPPFHPNCRGFIIAVDDSFEGISPRKDEPWRTLWISEDTYNYLKDDIEEIKDKRNWHFSIWMVEEAIVRNYTWDSYDNINKWQPPEVADRLEKVINYHIDYKKPTYRWMHLSKEELDNIINTATYDSRWFTSTSVNENIAKKFAELGAEEWELLVVMKVYHKWWMNITKYSQYDEWEVLLQRWKTLKIDIDSLKYWSKYVYFNAYEEWQKMKK